MNSGAKLPRFIILLLFLGNAVTLGKLLKFLRLVFLMGFNGFNGFKNEN